jgi:hypothetical protein
MSAFFSACNQYSSKKSQHFRVEEDEVDKDREKEQEKKKKVIS